MGAWIFRAAEKAGRYDLTLNAAGLRQLAHLLHEDEREERGMSASH